MRTEHFGPLLARVTGGVDGQGGGDGPVVVLLHGFGAPGHDLVDLGGALPVGREVRYVFPQAPLLHGAGYGEGRAWWMLDMEALERRARGEKIDRSGETPDGLAEVRAQMLELLSVVESKLGVTRSQIVLGGFSQGSMVACDVALHSEPDVAGLALLSSTLIAKALWEGRMASHRQLPILQSHGEQDPLLPYEDALRLRDLWQAAGAKVQFVGFRGAHEIPMPALHALTQFIQKVTVSAEK